MQKFKYVFISRFGLNSHAYFLQKVTRNQGLLNETGHESFINIHSQNYLVNYSPFSCVGKMSITHFINTGNLNASFVNKILTEELTWQTINFKVVVIIVKLFKKNKNKIRQ